MFNKAADSCDYPRNVACPKSKTSASTTRAPITAATSRTTYLYSTTTRRPSTAKPDPEEEYEYYEDEEEGGEVVEEEFREWPRRAFPRCSLGTTTLSATPDVMNKFNVLSKKCNATGLSRGCPDFRTRASRVPSSRKDGETTL